jgi:hypothetical protein
METMSQQTKKPVQSSARKDPPQEDYHSELRSWVQRAIVDAEENKDFRKKGQLLDLLKDLRE